MVRKRAALLKKARAPNLSAGALHRIAEAQRSVVNPSWDLVNIVPKLPSAVGEYLQKRKNATIFTTSFTPFFEHPTTVAADFHHTFATLYAKTLRNFGNPGYDVPTVE